MAGKSRRQRAVRSTAWTALFGATASVASLFATPAHADPTVPNAIPDSGARPAPAGSWVLPGIGPATGTTTPATVTGPLGQRIMASQTEVALLGEQVLALQQERDRALADLTVAETNLRQVRDALTSAQATADTAAVEALKAAAEMPPGEYGSGLQELDALTRLMHGIGGPDAEAAAVEVTRAQVAEQNANAYYLAMQNLAQTALDQYTAL